jgi:hypothetical protein
VCGKAATVQEICAFLKARVPKLIFLCETRQKSERVSRLNKRLGLTGFVGTDSDGLSGGLALFWHDSI